MQPHFAFADKESMLVVQRKLKDGPQSQHLGFRENRPNEIFFCRKDEGNSETVPMKPVGLMCWLVDHYGKDTEGTPGVVVDLCMGKFAVSGQAALRMGCPFIGIELKPVRFEECRKAMAALKVSSRDTCF